MSKQFPYYLAVCIIILFSFFHHSSLFSPILNSDDAVLILMIHDFNLPQDLYYWASNRGGSIIPLIGNFLYEEFKISPVASESLSRYLILILGYFGFASFFKSKFTKLIFAIIWFLPPIRMIDIVKIYVGTQLSLIGISLFFLKKLNATRFRDNLFKYHFHLVFVTLFFIASVWASEIAIVSIGIILSVFIFDYIRNNEFNSKMILKKPELYYIFFGFLFGALFIWYAKSNAAKEPVMYTFFDFKTMVKALNIFAGSIQDLFLFRIREPFTSIYTYLLFIAIIVVTVNHPKIKITENRKWILIFLLDIAIIFIIILTSKWAYLNGMPRRYFITNYISFWLAFLLIIENIQAEKLKRFLNGFLIIIVLIGGLGTIYNFKYISPKRLKPTIKIASEFKSLGEIGIIAEYWNSYITSVPDPDNIKATPNDQSLVRKPALVDSVFAQPELYVIRDMWMNSFPDTLQQFGYTLTKSGNEFRLGNCQVCKYEKIKVNKTFYIDDLKFNENVQIISDNKLNKKELYVSSSCDLCKGNHIVYGPYINLGVGDYRAKFRLKIKPIQDDAIALLDVSANYGQIQLASKSISKDDFATEDKFQEITLEFTTNQRYSNVEFRIFYLGNADLFFDSIQVTEN